MKRHALFVGVDQYADGHIPNLSCAVSDATDLHGFFKYGAGYDRVELLQNPAVKQDILDAVQELTSGLKNGDFFLFFFAGHGFRVGENHILVCNRDGYDDVKHEDAGLRLGQLKRRLSGSFDSALFLDACQSDILQTRGGEGIAERDLSLIHEAPEDRTCGGALTIVTSCDAGQTAAELSEARHGLFTMAMLDLLKEAQGAHVRIDLSDDFRCNLGKRMCAIAARSGLSVEQRPRFSCTGNSCAVLLDGIVEESAVPAASLPSFSSSASVICPLCGKHNDVKDTFRCPACGKDGLCLSHQSKDSYCCPSCAEKKSATGVAELKVKAEKASERLGANQAETEKRVRRPKRHALFVGVNGYEDVSFRNLRCAVRDATDLHEFFRFEAGYDQVELLLNPRGEGEVVGAVQKLTADLGGGDLFLFFFTGHGFRVMGNDVLACAGDSYKDMIRGDHVLSLCKLKRHLPSGVFDCALFLDAGRPEIIATRDLSQRDLILSDGPRANAFAVVSSCDIGQAPVESWEMHHGLFAMALLDLLKEAGKAHARLDLSFAFIKRLKERMNEIAARFGLPTEQCPRMSCSGTPIVLLDEAPSTAEVG